MMKSMNISFFIYFFLQFRKNAPNTIVGSHVDVDRDIKNFDGNSRIYHSKELEELSDTAEDDNIQCVVVFVDNLNKFHKNGGDFITRANEIKLDAYVWEWSHNVRAKEGITWWVGTKYNQQQYSDGPFHLLKHSGGILRTHLYDRDDIPEFNKFDNLTS